MPRVARTVAKGYPHHITQRGNYRQVVFEAEADYLQYLEWLKQYGNKYGLDIWAYCLMNNHVHFVCVPKKQDSLSRTFNTLHMRYSQHVNRRKKVSGHLWQGRFYSTILDEAHVYASIRYVENNPVRAGVVKNAEDYQWSSARDHIKGNFDDAIVSNNCYLLEEVKDWRRYLRERQDEKMIHTIRKGSLTGRPSGDEGFVKRLEKKFGRRLQALPHGRPKKTEK
jgi:putative transposase